MNEEENKKEIKLVEEKKELKTFCVLCGGATSFKEGFGIHQNCYKNFESDTIASDFQKYTEKIHKLTEINKELQEKVDKYQYQKCPHCGSIDKSKHPAPLSCCGPSCPPLKCPNKRVQYIPEGIRKRVIEKHTTEKGIDKFFSIYGFNKKPDYEYEPSWTDLLEIKSRHEWISDKYYPHLPTIVKFDPKKILEVQWFVRKIVTKREKEKLKMWMKEQIDAYFYLGPYIHSIFNEISSAWEKMFIGKCTICGLNDALLNSVPNGKCRLCHPLVDTEKTRYISISDFSKSKFKI